VDVYEGMKIEGEKRQFELDLEAKKAEKRGSTVRSPSGRIRFLFCLQQKLHPRVGLCRRKAVFGT
jgi:hypothetical protein